MQKINIDICKKCKNFLEFPSKKEGWKKAICGIAHAIIYFEQEYHAISDGDFEIPRKCPYELEAIVKERNDEKYLKLEHHKFLDAFEEFEYACSNYNNDWKEVHQGNDYY